jgi:hypothetical protein
MFTTSHCDSAEIKMNMRQTYIATFEAKPGMRLGRPISKVFNHRLYQLPAGTELTEEQIRQMAVRGIHCLVIDEADPRSTAQLEQDRARIETEVQRVFSEADLSRPAIASLYEAVMNYRLLHA